MGKPVSLSAACIMCALFAFAGCADDNGGSSKPNPVSGVEVSPHEASVEIGHTTDLTATVSGGDTKDVNWYVNDLFDGDPVVGTISRNSPATYTAPDSLIDPPRVVVKAVSVEDDTKMDSCVIDLTFTVLHVNGETGSDAAGNGCISLPVRTITHALSLADSGQTILVAPWTYDEGHGEVFPMYVPEGVSLVGEDWEACLIRGHTQGAVSPTGIVLDDDASALRKFTIQDVAEPGPDRWQDAVYAGDATGILVDSVRIFERSYYSCIRLSRSYNSIVQNCVLEVPPDPPLDIGFNRGLEIVFDNYGAVIRDCTVIGFHMGIFFNEDFEGKVEGCVLEGNGYGAYLCCHESSTSNPNPDFGGGLSGGAGGNIIRGNPVCGLFNSTTSTVYAKYNMWNNDPPEVGTDICTIGTGSIITE